MTRDEAIEWLGRIKDRYIHGGDEGFDNKRKEAIDMAIEALQTLQTEPMITRCKDCFFEECKAKEFYGENGFCSIGMRKRKDKMKGQGE